MNRVLACCVVATCLLTAAATADGFGGGVQESKPAAASSSDRGVRTYDVKKRTLTSTARPALTLKHGKDLKYVGTQSFTLYDVADAEQHFFIDADKENRIRRLYWVQFEGYLPTNTHTYNYKSKETARLGDFVFMADSQPVHIPTAKANQRPGSDGARARDFIEGKGYKFASDDMLYQRLVHLVDATRRDELLIIYMEDLGGSGLITEDFAEKGKAANIWEDIADGLRLRAVNGIELKKK